MQIKVCGSVVGVNLVQHNVQYWQIFKMFTEMSSLQSKKIVRKHLKPKSLLLITEIDFPV